MTPRVLVAHPGRQHSHRTAAALASAGWLAGYWSGLPIRGRWAGEAAGLIPPSLHKAAPWAPALRRTLEGLLPSRWRNWGDFLSNRAFDRWAARRIRRVNVDVVVGYEVGCQRIFEAAKQLNILTVLDAAAIHYGSQQRWSDELSSSGLLRRTNRVKQRELELSDFVMTTSEFARRTYVEGGFRADRVRTVQLGANLERFRPDLRVDEGPLRFCFVGSTIERKGVRELDEAMARVVAECPEVEMRVAGAVLGPGAAVRDRRARGWRFHGKLRGEGLVDLYRHSDVLVLPSLEDSFGLVVPEALACGTPALVSDRTGACSLIQEGVNGWIVAAGDSDRLAERMLWIARNPGIVRGMRSACVDSVRQVGWESYTRSLQETLADFLRIGPRA